MDIKNTEIVRNVYAVVENTVTEKCIVKTLWVYRRDAEEYADEYGGRVVSWAVLEKKATEE